MKESWINIYQLDSYLNQSIRLWIGYQEHSNINSMMSPHTRDPTHEMSGLVYLWKSTTGFWQIWHVLIPKSALK